MKTKKRERIIRVMPTQTKGMYKKAGKFMKTVINVNASVEGETLETKLERILANKEKIKDGAPLIYTERKEGVKAAHNIRTDRFEIAIDGMTAVAKSHMARREARGATPDGEVDKVEPIHGKDDKPSTDKPKN